MTSEFVGVDGYHGGWVSVGYSDSGEYELKAFPRFDELVEYYHAAKLILVDMPIGLPEGGKVRHCDPEARRKLGDKRSRVFPVPTRKALTYLADNPGDWEGTRAVEQCAAKKSLSTQTLAIMPKIKAVDRVMQSRKPNANPEIREIHPEICFWALNNRHPMKSKKQEPEGIEDRLCVLEPKWMEPRAREILKVARAKFIESCVADDDILDALAAAVTARRGWPDQLKTLPKNPQPDGKGLTMEMVYWVPKAQ